MKKEYDFEENNKKYNDETFFKMDIFLEKTCYSKGEKIKGKIKLVPKDILKKSFFLNTNVGYGILEEISNYNLIKYGKNISEVNMLFKYPINVPKFDRDSIVQGMEIPFEFLAPLTAYPSCIIDIDSYVRHILIFDFPTIEVKRATIIIIKNNQYFSFFNELYKAPAELIIKTGKHQFGLFYKGEISAIIKLFKNVFAYNEAIPFTLDIDCSSLSIKLKQIDISIFLIIKKNKKDNHDISLSQIEKIIMQKSIPLLEQRKEYHLEDIIQLPKDNPNDIYKKLDLDKRIFSEKYKNIFLYPACYKGLITCQYFMKVTLVTDTLFSSNEFSTIQLDFFDNSFANKGLNESNVITPIASNLYRPINNLNNININDNNNNNNINSINNDSENNHSIQELGVPPPVNIKENNK